jgi:hypothetical protein
MRIATYNVEWFSSLFDGDGKLLDDDRWSARHSVTRQDQIAALGQVFQAIDADAVMVIEAPDSHDKRDGQVALETFAARFGLRAREALIGFANDTQQEIAILYDPDQLHVQHAPTALGAPRFDQSFTIDLDWDAHADPVRFSKPPLEVTVDSRDRSFRMIGVHTKSKAPHAAKSAAEVMSVSIANRRKALAQCIWLRKRITAHLEQGDSLVVLGDLNDGPGLDAYEKLFGRSSVEIVLGEDAAARLFDPHAEAALTRRLAASPTTARFYQAQKKRYLSALLDYIMVSQDLKADGPVWHIWHPFDDPRCFEDRSMCKALLTASDHFPVTLDFPAQFSK